MQRTMLKSKIHRATVSDSDLHYVGSITIDPDLLDAADIREFEQVAVVDVDNGARFETYTIAGTRLGRHEGQRRGGTLVHRGDTIIVISYATYENRARAGQHNPCVVHVDAHNSIVQIDARWRPCRRQPSLRRRMSATPHRRPQRLGDPLPMTLPRLAEKKRLGEPIVMVTAYDFPSAQVAEAGRRRRRVVGDSGAMTVLGYPSTVPVSTDEMLMLAVGGPPRAADAAARRRSAVRLLRGVRRAGDRDRAAVHQGGRLRRSQARAGRHQRPARPRDRRRRDPGDGSCRADAADRDRARRLPRSGPDRGSARCRSLATRSRWRRPAASRSCSRRSRRRCPRS